MLPPFYLSLQHTEAQKFELPEDNYPRDMPTHNGEPSYLVLEIRGNDNTYTMFPPSVHPCGETLDWFSARRDPADIDAKTLRRIAGLHAFAAAVLYFYPENASKRYDVRMAFAGTLLRAGATAEEVQLYGRAIAKLGGDPKWKEHFAKPTKRRLEADKPATGLTKLIEALGLPPACAATFREWLQIADDNRPLILELATRLWGEPTVRGENQYRFGQKIIEPRSGLWFDFESNVGGRLQDLMEMAASGAASEEEPKLIWHGDVDPRESRPYLVQYVIPEVGCGLFSGQWGMFKTFVAFDLAHCVMARLPFIGFEVARQGGVLFVALEGSDEVAIRLQGVIEHKGNLQGQAPFVWIETCPALTSKNAAAKLSQLAEAAATQLREKFDLPLALIVIDTMIAAAGYAKEGQDNDTATGQMVMGTMREVARKAGCFVFGVDHFGKDVSTGTRGTSVKEGTGDVIFALLGEKTLAGEVTHTRLALRKRRGGKNGEEFPFQPRVVDMGVDNRGFPMSTLVIDWGEQEESIDASTMGKAERVFLEPLREYTEQGRYVSSHPGISYAPSQFASNPKAEGCTKLGFKQAMDNLFNIRRIRNDEHGKGVRKRSHIAEVILPDFSSMKFSRPADNEEG